MSDKQQSLQTLQDQFNIPGKVALNQGQGGLPRIVVTTPLAVASLAVMFRGCHWPFDAKERCCSHLCTN